MNVSMPGMPVFELFVGHVPPCPNQQCAVAVPAHAGEGRHVGGRAHICYAQSPPAMLKAPAVMSAKSKQSAPLHVHAMPTRHSGA